MYSIILYDIDLADQTIKSKDYPYVEKNSDQYLILMRNTEELDSNAMQEFFKELL